MAIFVVRDDDACGFTKPEEIQACYENIWDDVPISLSVTPFRIPGDDKNLPGKLSGSRRVFPLHENLSLVQMIRDGVDAGRIDISMHGYHHLCYKGLPEYVGGSRLEEKTREGRAYLEELLDINVLSFVPPHNSISLAGINAVSSARMNLVNVQSLWSSKRRTVTVKSLMLSPKFYWYKKVKGRRYPYILDFGDHKEVEYHTVGPRSRQDELIKQLDFCIDRNGVFVLSTHYHAFDRSTQDGRTVRSLVFNSIDRAISRQNVKFLGINSIW